MMERVWLRHGGTARRFALADGRKLDVEKIARFWKLDPATISIGSDVVEVDQKGKSVEDIDDIRELATSLCFGDGNTEATALEVRGSPDWATRAHYGGAHQYQVFAEEIFEIAKSSSAEDIFKRGNVIRFPSGIPFLPDNTYNAIWVHRSYPEIAAEIESLLSSVRSVHIVGKQGTGKSAFGVLWLVYLALKKKVVLYRGKDKTWVRYDFSGSITTVQVLRDYLEALPYVDSSVWLIVDGASKPIYHPGPVLQLVTDDPRGYMEFAEGCGKLLFLESWSQADCEVCVQNLDLQVDDLELRFFCAGGVPRCLFNQMAYTVGDLKSRVDAAAASIGDWETHFTHCLHDGPPEQLVQYKYTRNLLDPNEPWMGYAVTKELAPGSEYAKEVILSGLGENPTARGNFIDNLGRVPQAAGLIAVVFERIVHEELSKGGSFTMRSLDGKAKSDDFRKSIRPLRAVSKYLDRKTGETYLYAELFTTRPQIHLKDKLPFHLLGWEHYVKPVMKTEGSFDSFLMPGRTETGFIFQTAVSVSSPIKWDCVEEHVKMLDDWCANHGRALPPKYWFVFVVPEELFAIFRNQKCMKANAAEPLKYIDRVEQYVLTMKGECVLLLKSMLKIWCCYAHVQ